MFNPQDDDTKNTDAHRTSSNGLQSPEHSGAGLRTSGFTRFLFSQKREDEMNLVVGIKDGTPPVTGADSDARELTPDLQGTVSLSKRAGYISRKADAGDRAAPKSMTETTKPLRVGLPTAIIGWGGTGQRILTKAKVHLIETYGAVPEDVALLCFDSDSRDPVAYRESRFGSVVRLEPSRELFILDPVPVASIKRNPEKHPDFMAGLGEEVVNAIPRAFVGGNGAAQDRTQGSAYYRWHGLMIEKAVEGMLRRLTGRNQDLRHELTSESSIQLFMVGSMGGGQGSGALTDHALVINDQLEDLGMIGENSTVIGCFVDPSAFHGIERKEMRANAAAFALELNALMRRTLRPSVRYAGRSHLRTKERPFNHVFIFGGRDATGKAFANHDEVCAIAAVTLWLLTCTEVGAKEIGAALNESAVLEAVSSEGFGTYVSSGGAVKLVFSGRDVADLCAARAAQSALATVVATPSTPIVTGPVVEVGTIHTQLQYNTDGQPYQTRLTAAADLEQAPVDAIPDRARKVADNFSTRRLHGEMLVQVRAKADSVRSQALLAYEAAFMALLSGGSLPACTAWVKNQLVRVNAEVDRLAAVQGDIAHAVEQAQAQVDAAHGAMLRLAEGPSFITRFRRGDMLNLLAQYLDRTGALARVRLDQRIAEEAANIAGEMAKWLAKAQRTLVSLEIAVQQAADRLKTVETQGLLHKGGRAELNVADAAVLDHLYASCSTEASAYAATAAARTGGLQAWQHMAPEEVAQRLMDHVQPAFARIAAMTVEDALQMRWSDRSPQQWIERMEQLAAPAWNPDRAQLPGGGVGLAAYTTIGVPDATRSIFADCGRTLVSTNNPEQITVLRTVYGASFDAMKPWEQWLRDYKELVDKRPLHIHRNLQRDEDRTARTFALGLIYEQIYRNGAWFYFRPADRLQEPVRLAQGLEKALAALAALPTVQTEIEQRVAAQMAAEGHAATTARIQSWIDRQSNGDETMNLLRRLARETVKQRFASAVGTGQP